MEWLPIAVITILIVPIIIPTFPKLFFLLSPPKIKAKTAKIIEIIINLIKISCI